MPVIEQLCRRPRSRFDRHLQGRRRPAAIWRPGRRSSTTSPGSTGDPRHGALAVETGGRLCHAHARHAANDAGRIRPMAMWCRKSSIISASAAMRLLAAGIARESHLSRPRHRFRQDASAQLDAARVIAMRFTSLAARCWSGHSRKGFIGKVHRRQDGRPHGGDDRCRPRAGSTGGPDPARPRRAAGPTRAAAV